jgi:type I restriction enzyme R subunit
MIPLDQAITVLREKYDVTCAFFHGIDYQGWRRLAPVDLTRLLQRAHNAVVADDELKSRFLKACAELTRAFALVSPHPEAAKIRDDVAFFQHVRRSVVKYTPPVGQPVEELDLAVKQLVSEAVASDEVVDIFGAAGLKKPDISILSDEFLAEVQGMGHKNLQVELLRRLIDDEIRVKMRRNVVRYRSFKEMLEQVLKAYRNRSLQSAEVIARLVELARELRAVEHRGRALGLTEEEMAFYDAVAKGQEHIGGDEQLKTIARELVAAIKKNLSIDWTDHENVKARIRATVKRLLRRHGYKPAACEPLVVIIMEQAENLYRDWPEAA